MFDDDRNCMRCRSNIDLIDLEDVIICSECIQLPDAEEFVEKMGAELDRQRADRMRAREI